mgnify:FL=1|jgi:hypothetical protein
MREARTDVTEQPGTWMMGQLGTDASSACEVWPVTGITSK